MERKKSFSFLQKIPYAVIGGIISITLLYFIFPFFLRLRLGLPFVFFLLFYMIVIFLVSYIHMESVTRLRHVKLCRADIDEKTNLLKEDHDKEINNNVSLRHKISRYKKLRHIIERINTTLDTDHTADNLVSIAFSAIAGDKGVCFLYLFDSQSQKLKLFKTKKEDKNLVVKTKSGDIFDEWVIRHQNCLYVDNIRKDFRFDQERIKQDCVRPIVSLISAPFISNNRVLGLLRMDSIRENFYSIDDLRFLMTICDVGAVALENNELYEKTKELAIHDGLTSLYRKGYFLDRLRGECKRCERQRRGFSFLMIDIDYFKNYNDEFGHPAGDIVLKMLSDTIVDSFKDKTSLIGRFGGEEFCVILSETDKNEARSIAEELRRRVENTSVDLDGRQRRITVSIGVASFPEDAREEVELIIKADKAMYEAKKSGRNRVVVNTPL